ncbi:MULTISPECIES: chromate efflux transporter [Cupriavidus]|uniref:Chromate efflux transporter n=1 Tax=Cupriavidus metallidurans TaxID=119219 RepID=A0A2L0X1L2_9BURK|nr:MULTISPECIES: chromate efflux transporter [Cupriavidus]AVA33971.1 chromate transporter [Cupriavidus metallidurans]KWR86909.1 chromate transporter [Cupriavidus sp. SHE]QBP12752.1 chromate efflux transporter [Cupriavidus metallidurans]QWC90537.1 chromate efflux transporter [Cupriavidus metallidurans]
MSTLRATETHRASQSAWEVFLVFLRLGLTSFGGPIAHLGYFRDAFVTRRRWLSEHAYSDIVALCQFLPGPASSQVGMVVGLSRAGYPGALAAWVGFTLPSAIALILFALGLSHYGNLVPPSALHGLKVAAVAVVAQAVWGMARSLCPDAPRITLMILAAVAVTLIPSPWCQVGVMVVAGMVGAQRFRTAQVPPHEPLSIPVGHGAAIGFLLLFAGLLAGLPVVASMIPNHALALVDAFYRAGALVFGGGHVVLPLLQAAVVPTGWVDNDTFLAGYGATQAVPGPLFTFAAFLGAAGGPAPTGWIGGIVCLLAIFAPSFLLVLGALPFWERLRRHAGTRAALAGVNAAVVGLLLSALYQPVWTSAIHAPADFALALLALAALTVWRVPPWAVVTGCALAGWGMHVGGMA